MCCSSMRRTEAPFSYVRRSNIASQSRGARTSYSMGRLAWSPSTPIAAARETPKLTQRCHSGFQAWTASISMKVANASLSQIPFHHTMVTRSPNHMWASSCATTSAIRSRSMWDAAASSTRRAVSRNVIAPRFSIAPAAKSGIARRSTLSPGYGMP